MPPIAVLFAPGIDAALVELIDHVDVDNIPTVLDFLERIQKRLVETLRTFPEAGPIFQGEVRMFSVEGYVFLYESHPSKGEVHVLDIDRPEPKLAVSLTRYPIQQEHPMLSMEDVLGDDTLFCEKFCADATLDNLGKVPVGALRETVRMIHRASGFRAAATAEFYTPAGSEQPVVVFGRPTIAGAMKHFIFGLTTDVRSNGQPGGEKLFLWVPEAEVRHVSDKNKDINLRFVSSWLPWRQGGAMLEFG